MDFADLHYVHDLFCLLNGFMHCNNWSMNFQLWLNVMIIKYLLRYGSVVRAFQLISSLLTIKPIYKRFSFLDGTDARSSVFAKVIVVRVGQHT